MASEVENKFKNAINFHQKGDLVNAERVYREILESHPEHADSLHLLGVIAYQMGQNEAAVALISKAIGLNPSHPSYHCNLGNAFLMLDKLDMAEKCFRHTISINKEHSEAYGNLGAVLHEQYNLEEEIKIYNEALKHIPDDTFILNELVKTMKDACQWDNDNVTIDALNDKLISRTKREIMKDMPPSLTPFHSLYTLKTPEEQKKFARHYAKHKFAFYRNQRNEYNFKFTPEGRERIRIGYLSADFGNHPTGHLMRSMLSHHDRGGFEVYVYSYGRNDGSIYRKSIENSADKFINLEDASIPDMAKRIYADGIDILIDAMGYIQNSRPEVLALRPASIQVGFLAYAGTMGADFIDYIVTDKIVIPENEQKFYTEKTMYMPNTYFVTDDLQHISEKNFIHSDCGLPEDKFIFCCFNKPYKIDKETLDLWSEILEEVPNSVLWLYSKSKFAEANIIKEAEKRGVDSDRIIFAKRVPKEEHLARYKLADLFLDCLNINAHTTAIDALWAGVPVITCPGKTIISRASSSIVSAAGIPELIATDRDEYKKLAIYYASHHNDLRKLKDKVESANRNGQLFNTEIYVKDFEKGLRQAYKRYLKGKQPENI